MTRLLIALCIGAAAGVIDITPMIFSKADRQAVLTAFTHWLVLGVLIAYVQFGLPAWLNGLTVAVLVTLPVLMMMWKEKRKSVLPIFLMSIVLGALVGMADAYLIR